MSALCKFIGAPPTSGGGPTYTDAQAVAAVSTFADERTKNRQTPASAAGTFATYAQIDTAVDGSPSGTPPGPLAGGIYTFDVQIVATGTSAGSQIELRVIVDEGQPGEFTLAGPLQDYTVANGVYAFYGKFAQLPFAPGNHTIGIQFRQPGGPGTSQAIGGQVTLRRDG